MGCSTGCWVWSLLNSSIGKKTVMAITGLALFGFVVAHLVGNLQVFIPDDGKSINAYGHLLKSKPALIWTARLTLLALLFAHVITAIRLSLENNAARPVGYQVKNWREASYASRTMMISGPLIFLYVVYHLLHFTVGVVHPKFDHEDVYRNVILGFQSTPAALVYIAAMLMLATHLRHGLWSLCQTLGINHPKYTPALKAGSTVVAAAIAVGYISIPVSVMIGILK
ncbi:MAG: succinate dehydrogenase cytochrome b subunit [Planctomycetes bacterium]|nr:succinate dehydrogenase cytochrome b subunit [Planctomycetota bacterium]